MRRALLGSLLAAAVIAACAEKDRAEPSSPFVSIQGQVRDWKTHAAVGGAQLRTIGMAPERTTTAAADGTFTIEEVYVNGYVLLQVDAAGYVTTRAPAILVEEQPVTGLLIDVIGQADADAMETGFGVTDSAGLGHILGEAVRPSGSGIPGISNFNTAPFSANVSGPWFLTTSGDANASLTSTTSSGGFVFFNVEPGNVAVWAQHPGFIFQNSGTIVAGGTWSLVRLEGDGDMGGPTPTPFPTATPACASPTPQFVDDIYPIFRRVQDDGRGCAENGACHSGGGAVSGLRLDGNSDDVHARLLDGRVDLTTPANSLLLEKPLLDTPPDHVGGNIFLTTTDPDYVQIFCWIADGAPNNGGE